MHALLPLLRTLGDNQITSTITKGLFSSLSNMVFLSVHLCATGYDVSAWLTPFFLRDLQSNHITSILSGAFSEMTRLSTL
jgi:hypothetical protein